MGGKKSKAPPPKKAKHKLDTTFNCPFCNSNKSVQCTLDMEAKQGTVRCNLCPASYTHAITHLTEPIDLYHDWLDDCEDVNNQ